MFLKRLAAFSYDSVLVLALWFIASLPVVWIGGGPPEQGYARLLYQIYLFVIAVLFFTGFWTHGGQTLGMRAWRLRLINSRNGKAVTWRQALIRVALALVTVGIGLLWATFDAGKQALYDRIAGTRMIQIPKV